MKSTINKNIILVGPGHLPIPVTGSNGWGGIENTLTWITEEFLKRGQQFTLINNRFNYIDQISNAVKGKESIVHLHYDDYAPSIKNQNNCVLIATSHSPYHPHKNTWDETVKNHFNQLYTNIDGYYGQCEMSNLHALEVNKNLKTGLCRCGIPGIQFEKFRLPKGNKKSIVIGKIEKRKNQSILQHLFSDHLYMDFVGPLNDDSFVPHVKGKTNYLGTWSRDEVLQKLSEYSSLILLSSFEGDVLVVKEALAAGCSVIVSEPASLNLDRTKPFIKIIPNHVVKDQFIKTVEMINEENENYRGDIINYFNNQFEIKNTVNEYINTLIKNYG
jgi:glycosyltransferase involved in cell wall biosynthesis